MAQIPLRGDRAAHDSKGYPRLHASDLDAGTPIQHLPTVAEGQLPQWDGTQWIGVNLTASTITPQILRYDAETKAYLYYSLDAAGLTAALAAASEDDAVILPPCNITGDFTIPLGVILIGQGPGASQILGTITLSAKSELHSVWVQKNNVSIDEAVAIIGPETEGAQIQDCRIGCLCSDIAGNAIGILVTDGWVGVRNTYIRVTAQNPASIARVFRSDGSQACEAYTCILANTGSLFDAPADNWGIYDGNQPFLSSCTWHTGYSAPNISYRPGDRAPLAHTHLLTDITDYTPGAGSGDMLQSVYDTDSDNIVEQADYAAAAGYANEAGYAATAGSQHANTADSADALRGIPVDVTGLSQGSDGGLVLTFVPGNMIFQARPISGSYMTKADYDTNQDGVVDNAAALNGHPDTYFAVAGHSHTAEKRQLLATVEGSVEVRAGKLKFPNHTGTSYTLLGVYLDIDTAPLGADLIVNVKKNGQTLTTPENRPHIAAGSLAGNTAALSLTSWADGETITVDVDQVGSAAAGSDLTITMVYR